MANYLQRLYQWFGDNIVDTLPNAVGKKNQFRFDTNTKRRRLQSTAANFPRVSAADSNKKSTLGRCEDTGGWSPTFKNKAEEGYDCQFPIGSHPLQHTQFLVSKLLRS